MHVRRFLIAAAALLLASGCSTSSRHADPSLRLVQRVDHLGVPVREPMIGESPAGAIYVAGYNRTEQSLWKSVDRGATWSRVDFGANAAGHVGNSDIDFAIAPDGTLYLISMTFDRTTFEGTRIAMGVSGDGGATWNWRTLSAHRYDDRPWVEVAPDGTAHAIWNDGSGVLYVTSSDRGATWSEPRRIHDRGGSSHLAVSPCGAIAVRITPPSASGNKFHGDTDLILVSDDRGATWTQRAAPGTRHWVDDPHLDAALPRWVEPIAFDTEGTLYSLWTDERGVWIARSRGNEEWSIAHVAESTTPSFYPYLISRGEGELVATWFSRATPQSGTLRWHLATIHFAPGRNEPLVKSSEQRLDTARRDPESDQLSPTTAGEYLSIAALQDGSIAVVSPIHNDPANEYGFTFWRFAPEK